MNICIKNRTENSDVSVLFLHIKIDSLRRLQICVLYTVYYISKNFVGIGVFLPISLDNTNACVVF